MKVTLNATDFDESGFSEKLDSIITEALDELREDPGGDSANIELEIINDLEPEDEEESEDEESEDATPSKED